MRSASDMIRHPSHLFDRATSVLHRRQSHRPLAIGTGSLVALVLLALGIYWLYPEIRRYARIERM